MMPALTSDLNIIGYQRVVWLTRLLTKFWVSNVPINQGRTLKTIYKNQTGIQNYSNDRGFN